MARIYKLAIDINKTASLCGGNTVNSIEKHCETSTITDTKEFPIIVPISGKKLLNLFLTKDNFNKII